MRLSEGELRTLARQLFIIEFKKELSGRSMLYESNHMNEKISIKGVKQAAQGAASKVHTAIQGAIQSGKYPKANIGIIEKEMDTAGIKDRKNRVAVLSVMAKESGLKPKSEISYSNTSLARIKKIWPWLGKKYSDDELEKLKKSTSPSDGHKQPGLGLFDLVYADKYGNGSKESGDGSRYRGRGLNQITFKGSYKKRGALAGVDLVGNPDALNDIGTAAKVGVAFLAQRMKSKHGSVDPDLGSQAEANKQWANANAGWGKKGSALARAIASTNKASQSFT